jgi:hypothetical protein
VAPQNHIRVEKKDIPLSVNQKNGSHIGGSSWEIQRGARGKQSQFEIQDIDIPCDITMIVERNDGE